MAASGNKRISISGTSNIPIGSGHPEYISSVVFEVSSASSLSMVPKAALEGSGTTPASVAYVNLLTGSPVAAGTALTADGIYGVFAPGMSISVTPTAGTATLDWDVVAGKV